DGGADRRAVEEPFAREVVDVAGGAEDLGGGVLLGDAHADGRRGRAHGAKPTRGGSGAESPPGAAGRRRAPRASAARRRRGGARPCPCSVPRGTGAPSAFSIALSCFRSSGAAKLVARPVRSAREVRPTRCT